MSGDDAFSLVEPLTEREEDVLAHLAQGKSNREIANALFLSINTIKWYNRQIFGKLGVANREEAVARARALRLLPQEVGHERRARALPAPATRILGRETELKEIRALLTDGEARLVSIVGPGGMGKTRLALEVAHNLAAKFADGAAFAGLAPLRSAESIVPALADALRFKFAAGAGESRDERRQMLDYLREKTLLLVLDNFEHLLDGVILLSEILENAPRVKLLVTSRERLKLQVEHVYKLQGLVMSHWQNVEQARQSAAVELFVQHGQRIRPDYELRAEDLHALRRVVKTAEGMPLAIILSAAWLALMGPAEIADEIARSLDFLEADYRDLPPRQRSVRAVFETTWKRLSDRDRGLLAGLSVFRGGFTLEAARDVAGAGPRELLRLIDHSLLGRNSNGRYEAHELLRQFSAEKLAKSKTRERQVRDKHSAYYMALLQKQESSLKGSAAEEVLHRLAADIDNVHIAWDYALSSHHFRRLAAGAFTLATFCLRFGHYEEGSRAFQQAVEALREHIAKTHPGSPSDIIALVVLLAWHCSLQHEQGAINRATALGDEALTLLENPTLEESEAFQARALVLASLAWVKIGRDQTAEAQSMLDESIVLSEAAGDTWQTARSTFYLGGAALKGAEFEQAEQLHRRALHLFEELGDIRWIARAKMALGYGLHFMNDPQAEELLKESIELFRAVGDPGSGAMATALLAEHLSYSGKFQEARELAGRSVDALEEIGMKYWLAVSQALWCRATLHLGDYDGVLNRLRGMLSDIIAMRATMLVANTEFIAGSAHLAQGTPERAISRLSEAAKVFEEISAWDYLCQPLIVLSCAYTVRGDLSAAGRSLRQVPSIAQEQNMRDVAAGMLAAAALFSILTGQDERSVELYALARTHPSIANSRWWEDVVGRRIRTEAAKLPAEKMAAATARGETADLWATAANFLEAL